MCVCFVCLCVCVRWLCLFVGLVRFFACLVLSASVSVFIVCLLAGAFVGWLGLGELGYSCGLSGKSLL